MIHNLSLVDQMVDRLLFTPWFGAELRAPMSTTQKSGWSPFPAGYQRLLAEFPLNESMAVDKKLWDWTMPSWVVYSYVLLKFQQTAGEEDDWYWRAVWARLYHVLGPGSLLMDADGVIWKQKFWGLMKSGMLLTLSLNSAAQEAQHLLAWIRTFPFEEPPMVWAMGDDKLVRMSLDEEQLRLYWRALELTGCRVKKIEYSREFCGFLFLGADDVRPLYPEKHKFILRHLEPSVEEETLLSYELLYALSQDRWLDRVIDKRLGLLARLWAQGLINLKVIRELPTWTEY